MIEKVEYKETYLKLDNLSVMFKPGVETIGFTFKDMGKRYTPYKQLALTKEEINTLREMLRSNKFEYQVEINK